MGFEKYIELTKEQIDKMHGDTMKSLYNRYDVLTTERKDILRAVLGDAFRTKSVASIECMDNIMKLESDDDLRKMFYWIEKIIRKQDN